METSLKQERPDRGESKKLLTLFFKYFKMGAFTFGGGFSIIAQMQNEFVKNLGWLTEEELLDYVSVGKSMPGIMIINVAVISGYHMAGIPGALLAAFGIASPSLITIALLTGVYTTVRDNMWVQKALVGIRAAVIPIMANAALSLKKTAIKDWKGYGIVAFGVVLGLFLAVQNTLLVISGAVIGLVLKGGNQDASLS